MSDDGRGMCGGNHFALWRPARSRHRRTASPEEPVKHQPARILQEPRPKTRGLSAERAGASLGRISKSALQDRFRMMSPRSCVVHHAYRLLLMKRAPARSDAELLCHQPRYLEVAIRRAALLLSAELPGRSRVGGSSGHIDRARRIASRWRQVFTT